MQFLICMITYFVGKLKCCWTPKRGRKVVQRWKCTPVHKGVTLKSAICCQDHSFRKWEGELGSERGGRGASRAKMLTRTQRSDTQIGHFFVIVILSGNGRGSWAPKGEGTSRAKMLTRTQRSDTQIGHFFVTIIFRKMGEVAGLRKGRRGENGAHARNGLARYIWTISQLYLNYILTPYLNPIYINFII